MTTALFARFEQLAADNDADEDEIAWIKGELKTNIQDIAWGLEALKKAVEEGSQNNSNDDRETEKA